MAESTQQAKLEDKVHSSKELTDTVIDVVESDPNSETTNSEVRRGSQDSCDDELKPLIKTESSVGSDVSTSCLRVDDANSDSERGKHRTPTWAKTPQELEKHYDSMIKSSVTHQGKYLYHWVMRPI